jgi:hypothetical protein
VTGPPLQRLLASLAIGIVLAGAYWWAADAIPRAMLAEVDATARFVVVGGR